MLYESYNPLYGQEEENARSYQQATYCTIKKRACRRPAFFTMNCEF